MSRKRPLRPQVVRNDRTSDETAEYWTAERMAAAEPVDLPVVDPAELGPETGDEDDEEPSTSIFIPSGEPGRPQPGGTPARADVNVRPFWNVGKLFYTKPSGGDFYGSAEFVGSPNVIMTAAHCLWDFDARKQNDWFAFYRAYEGGGGQRIWLANGVIWNAYYESGRVDWRYDYGFCKTETPSGAGWLGFATGRPYTAWTAVGYPSNFEIGEYQQRVDGTKGQAFSGLVQMRGNSMSHGASGGAWIGDLSTPHPGPNIAIGLNSFKQDPENVWGPLFDLQTYQLLVRAEAL